MTIKAFRLFVSSTFTDFAAERDVLQRQVFPALDAYCTAKGYQFYPLDLRWGVNEEAQLDQRTAEICLNEVRAAKQDYPPPNFLILIGNRYGFVPLPYAIAQDEFDAMVAWLEGRNRQDAIGALRSVYRQDSNHLMPPRCAHAPTSCPSSSPPAHGPNEKPRCAPRCRQPPTDSWRSARSRRRRTRSIFSP